MPMHLLTQGIYQPTCNKEANRPAEHEHDQTGQAWHWRHLQCSIKAISPIAPKDYQNDTDTIWPSGFCSAEVFLHWTPEAESGLGLMGVPMAKAWHPWKARKNGSIPDPGGEATCVSGCACL